MNVGFRPKEKFRREQGERLLKEFNKIIHAKYMLAQWMEQQGIGKFFACINLFHPDTSSVGLEFIVAFYR